MVSPLLRKITKLHCAASGAINIDDIIVNVWNPTHCNCVDQRYYSLSLKPNFRKCARDIRRVIRKKLLSSPRAKSIIELVLSRAHASQPVVRSGIKSPPQEVFMDQAKAQGSAKAGSFHDNPEESIARSVNHGEEAVATAASEAADAGETGLKALRSDLRDLKETVEKLISRGSNEAAKSAREAAGQVSTAASDIAERGAHVASAATDQAKTLVTELENIARRNPLGALAGAVVIGILIGLMGRRN